MAGKQLTFDMSLTDRTFGDTLRDPLKDEEKLQSCDRPLRKSDRPKSQFSLSLPQHN